MLISTKAMKRIVNFLAGGIALGISQACALAQTSPPQAAAANPADLSQYQTADALWLHIQDLQRGPNTRPTTQEQYQSELMQNSMELAASAVAFIEKYPDDPRRWDATLLEIISSTGVERLRGHPDPVGYISQLRALATVQQAPADAVRIGPRSTLSPYTVLSPEVRKVSHETPCGSVIHAFSDRA